MNLLNYIIYYKSYIIILHNFIFSHLKQKEPCSNIRVMDLIIILLMIMHNPPMNRKEDIYPDKPIH